ncbi:hypothetical protein COLO4_36058 [Corchorus olitorius]|uniref:Uncharacterized protein n=1 Tax=Corchorus olitorius TaxID=93759 RepID=A0A1R3GB69_9ROSI|nr:hypothetical protein COLO4_36058 [Corchorus olitorius]
MEKDLGSGNQDTVEHKTSDGRYPDDEEGSGSNELLQ